MRFGLTRLAIAVCMTCSAGAAAAQQSPLNGNECLQMHESRVSGGAPDNVASRSNTFDKSPGKKSAGLAEALRRIAKAKELGSEELDLIGLELTEVPARLNELSALKRLF